MCKDLVFLQIVTVMLSFHKTLLEIVEVAGIYNSVGKTIVFLLKWQKITCNNKFLQQRNIRVE